MPKSIVILQPQYFPWVGVFEQIRLADIYVHYDDVQYSRSGYMNRVQVKTPQGVEWMSVPVLHSGFPLIKNTPIKYDAPWVHKHLEQLRHHYFKAPYYNEMMDLVRPILEKQWDSICELNMAALESISGYFGFKTRFERSSTLGIASSSTQRVVAICRHYDATHYITGHGAKNYIDYDQFENAGISLEYMEYQKRPYPQFHGDFTPYVSILDLIAHCGKDGAEYIVSSSRYWRDVLAETPGKS
ncbi:MAG: WbqC family protein [Alphaproteobacteria bacterium]|nr:WbqC family protein [Alphaproteobacteria bacterium]